MEIVCLLEKPGSKQVIVPTHILEHKDTLAWDRVNCEGVNWLESKPWTGNIQCIAQLSEELIAVRWKDDEDSTDVTIYKCSEIKL